MQIVEIYEKKLMIASRLHTILGIISLAVSLLLGVGAWFGPIKSDNPIDVRIVIGVICFLGVIGGLLLSVGMICVERNRFAD